MTPDDDRGELLNAVLEMLLEDRARALKAGNINTALQAAVKVAELLALKLQPQDGTGKDIAVQPDEVDPRQLGRAILAVLGSGVMDDGPEDDDVPRAKHELTATLIDDAAADPLDLSDDVSAKFAPTLPAIGERILCGPIGAWVERCPDNRWRAMHADGSLHRYFHNRDEAEKQAAGLRW